MSGNAPGERRERRPVGIFRLVNFGWGVTLALVLGVVAVVVIGQLRNDPGRNPAPAAYPPAACEAFGHLAVGVDALERAVAGDASAREEVLDSVDGAGAAVGRLPTWAPGEGFEELLGAMIITLLDGVGALERDDADGAADRLAAAQELSSNGRRILSAGELRFTCDET